MIDRPLDLPERQKYEFENHAKDLDGRLQRHVSEILSEIDDDMLRKQIHFVVFEPNDAIPKRQYRKPIGKIQLLVEQLYRSYTDTPTHMDNLLKSSILVHEYYDIVDDLIDGDVKQGNELEVVVTNELVVPLLFKYIGKLGTKATNYWAEATVGTVGSFALELSSKPSASTYRKLLDQQSTLFGSMTGLCAVITGQEEAVKEAANIGRSYYCYEQLLRDYRQFSQGESNPWNAWNLLSSSKASELVEGQRREFHEGIAQLPTERRRLLEPLVATNIEAYQKWV